MTTTGMNHFTVLTDDVTSPSRFYRDLLGLTEGPRPPLGFPGRLALRRRPRPCCTWSAGGRGANFGPA